MKTLEEIQQELDVQTQEFNNALQLLAESGAQNIVVADSVLAELDSAMCLLTNAQPTFNHAVRA